MFEDVMNPISLAATGKEEGMQSMQYILKCVYTSKEQWHAVFKLGSLPNQKLLKEKG